MAIPVQCGLSTVKSTVSFCLRCVLFCLSDLSKVQGLFVQLTHLLCNKLVVIRSSRWKSDVHITLAAFELLSGLAQLSMSHLGLLIVLCCKLSEMLKPANKQMNGRGYLNRVTTRDSILIKG